MIVDNTRLSVTGKFKFNRIKLGRGAISASVYSSSLKRNSQAVSPSVQRSIENEPL
jgi:hypothetical protein